MPAKVQTVDVLMARLKLIQKRHAVETAGLKVRTQEEQEDLRLKMRSDQIEVGI